MRLEQFIQRLERYDLRHEQARIGADLQALAQNRSLLGDAMYAHIQAHGFSRGEQVYNAYSFALFYSPHLSLRMTLWMPVDARAEQQTFIYGLPHTHDFELYAVGYHGSGYRTVKYPVLNAAQVGVGTKPVLGAPEVIQLSRGELLHMRAFEDMHYQIPPDEFSVSLALMIAAPPHERRGRREWCFDENMEPIYSGLGTQEEHIYQRIEALWQRHQ